MPVNYSSVPSAEEAKRLHDGADILTAAEGVANTAHTAIVAGNPHGTTAGDVGADVVGAGTAAVGVHEGTYAHGDIATNTAARHTQGTDQALDTGGANEVTAVNAKDAVTKKHTQGTDQHLDFGGANQVAVADAKDAVDKKHTQGTDQGLDTGGANASTAADVKDAVDKKHTRSHALDSTSDHSIGSGAEGQCIGVSGGALGWVTPGGGGLPQIFSTDFPSTGVKDWATDGPGTEGGWTLSMALGSASSFTTLEFDGGDLNFSITGSPGATTAYFEFDLAAAGYAGLHYMGAGLRIGSELTLSAVPTDLWSLWPAQVRADSAESFFVGIEYSNYDYRCRVSRSRIDGNFNGYRVSSEADFLDIRQLYAEMSGTDLGAGMEMSATTDTWTQVGDTYSGPVIAESLTYRIAIGFNGNGTLTGTISRVWAAPLLAAL